MKKIVYQMFLTFSVLGLLWSCNRDRDTIKYTVGKIKIDSIEVVSDTMNVYAVQSIRTYSTYGSGCDQFYNYEYLKSGLTRQVTAYSATTEGPCTQALHVEMNQFNFQPQEKGTYEFKFWNGKNSAGQDVWIDKQIVVQ